MISATKLGTAALIASVLLSIAMPANAALKTCYGPMDGVGRGATAAIAFNKAKINWRIHTEDAYGMYFADWANAEEHGRSCKANGALTYCRVHARPCNAGTGFDGGVNKNPVYD